MMKNTHTQIRDIFKKPHNVMPMRPTENGFECSYCGASFAAIKRDEHRAACYGDRIVEDFSTSEEA
jgi:hypothetical protein